MNLDQNFSLESVNASNYGSSESLFLSAPPTEGTSSSGLEFPGAPATGTENTA